MWRENKRRDRVNGPSDPVLAADNGMKGMTEIESESCLPLLWSKASLRRELMLVFTPCRHALPIRFVEGTWVPRCFLQGELKFGLRPELSKGAPLSCLRGVRFPHKVC